MSRKHDVILLIMIYIATAVISIATGNFLSIKHPLIKSGIADIIATMIIFGFSVVRNNSSVYDPYWSVAPIFLTAYWIFISGDTSHLRAIVIFILILIWSNRLTYNFFRQWKGFSHEDWRYAAYRSKTGRWYWAVSFIGIHFFPTVIVFLACIPVYYAITSGNKDLQIMDFAASIVAFGAIAIETCADNQMRRYLLTRTEYGKTFQSGLWRVTRHPNYFGEVLFWWGMSLFTVDCGRGFWWTIFGPIIVTLLFIFISIPLIEERMKKSKPDYSEYQRRVSALIPWFPGK